jgi:hypothetical protein
MPYRSDSAHHSRRKARCLIGMTASRSQAGTNPTARHQRTCFQKTDAIVKDPCRSSRRMRHISTAEAENKGTPHFCRTKEHAPEGAKIRTRADLALYLRTWPSTLLASSAGPVGGTASLRGAAYDASSTQRQHPFSGKLHRAVPERKPRGGRCRIPGHSRRKKSGTRGRRRV